MKTHIKSVDHGHKISPRKTSARYGLIRSPRSLSVMLTFTCPASCDQCGTLSTPKNRENITLEAAISYIEQAKMLDFELVVFTGGEATLRWKDLLHALSYTRELDIKNRLVTNAHWAINERVASAKLQELVDAGLMEINYSTGDEHIKYIPLDRVATAVACSTKLGLHTCVMVETRNGRCVTRESVLNHPILQSLGESSRRLISITESPWMPLDPAKHYDYPGKMEVTEKNIVSRKGCTSVLGTYTVQGDGRIGACCGIGMRQIDELNVGHVGDSLEGIIELAENDVLKLAIRYLGPEKILQWAAAYDETLPAISNYAHHCQACTFLYRDDRVKNVLRNEWRKLLPVIQESAIIDEALVAFVTERQS